MQAGEAFHRTAITPDSGPFVYRLGRQVFNLERGVRFPYGLPLYPVSYCSSFGFFLSLSNVFEELDILRSFSNPLSASLERFAFPV